MPVVELTDVSKSYKKRILFSQVSMDVTPGMIVGLAGPNGSGKSVLLRMMCGFVAPDSGSVRIDPDYFDPGALFPADFGVLIDRPGYIAHESGIRNLLRLAAIRKKIEEGDVRFWMKKVGLDPDSATRVRHYSLGMKQKLGIVQAVMEGQRMLILDEPFNGLDESSAKCVRDIITEHRDQGGTVVFTSHDRRDMEELADRVFVIDAERVRAQPGKARDLDQLGG